MTDGNTYTTTGTVEAAMMAKSGKSQRVKLQITNGEAIWAGLAVDAATPNQGAAIEATINETVWNGQPSYWIKNWKQTSAPSAPAATPAGNGVSFGYVLKDGNPVRSMPTVGEQFAKDMCVAWAKAGTLGSTREAVKFALETAKAAWVSVMMPEHAQKVAPPPDLNDEIPWE